VPSWTTTELIANIRRKARIATSDSTYTDVAVLREADDAVNTVFLPVVSNLGQFHLVRTVDMAITADQADYRIPERAAGDGLVDVALINAGGSGYGLPNIGLAHVHSYASTGSSEPVGFAIQGAVLTVVPTPSTTAGTLRIKYTTRRGKLVATTAAAQVSAINTGTKVVTCTTVPAAWVDTSAYDLVQAKPGFDTLAIDQGVSAVSAGASGTLTFDDTLPTDLAVGDWVSLAWETPVVQLPMEQHGTLELVVASGMLEAVGDYAVAQAYDLKVAKALASWSNMASPRVKLRTRKIINHNSLMRSGRQRRWA
jgi:hypothetical protein